MTLIADMLESLRPSGAEERAMDARCEALLQACRHAMSEHGIEGTPTVQGSIAKGTWLAGSADIDCFLLLPEGTSEEALKAAAQTVGEQVLENPLHKYAQHPYLMGTFKGAEVDLVPAYAVASAGAKMSAVDRTPFHTDWVRTQLDDAARDDVRLLKQWCKGVEIYGAETATGGFSGYLLEVLIHLHGGFRGVLDWMAGGCNPRRLSTGDDRVDDDVSPLVVVDPVDPARNCAAAVQHEMLQRAQEAATAFADAPRRAFFHPAPPRIEASELLEQAMAKESSAWIGVVATPATDRLDIVFPQFQKAARSVAAELERAGFSVLRHSVEAYGGESRVGLQWMVAATELPAERVHIGPSAKKTANAEKFVAKWGNHPDAVDAPREVDGTWQVRLAIRHRTPPDWLGHHLANIAFGKHVKAALGPTPEIQTDPARAASEWAPRVADVVLARAPWQR